MKEFRVFVGSLVLVRAFELFEMENQLEDEQILFALNLQRNQQIIDCKHHNLKDLCTVIIKIFPTHDW